MPSLSHLQIILLPRRPRKLVHMPLDIALLLRDRSRSDLKQAHRHARPHLRQLHALPSRAHKHVVPHLDAVLDVLERHHAAAQLGARRDGFPGGEDVFEDLHDAFPERGAESFEDEVRVGFGYRAAGGCGEVVTEEHVVEREAGGGAVREVRHGQRRGLAAVLVQEQDVGQRVCLGAGHEGGQDVRAPVQPDGCREEEADFLGEGGESGGGAAGGGDQRSRIDDAREMGVFVIDGESVGGAGLGFVVDVGCVKGGVVGQSGRKRFPAREGSLELGALGGCLGIAEGEGASVEVVSPFSGLSSL